MPVLTAPEIATIRNHPHFVAKYLSVNPKNTVYSGQATGVLLRDDNSGGLYGFLYTGGSGTLADVENDMLIEVGTTPGARDIGSVRVRATPTVDTIFINEVSLGDLPISVNHHFTVYDLFLPDIKMLRLKPQRKNGSSYFNDFTEFHDYDGVYSNENINIEPKANITEQNADADRKKLPIKFSGFVDGYQTASPQIYRTVTLSGDESFAIATGATLSTYLWDVKDGTITVGTSASSNITVQFPTGFRYITLTVTDNLGTTSLRRVPIWVHDGSYVPISHTTDAGLNRGFSIQKDSTKDGRDMTFNIFGDTDSATEIEIPNTTSVCYWEDVDFNTDIAPEQYRHTYLGWVITDSIQVKQNGSYKLETAGIATWLKKLIGFGTQITDRGRTPQKWFEMENISPDRFVHYLLREYTTVIPLSNIYFSGITKSIQAETAKRSSVWQQVKDVMQAHFAFALADSTNQIFLRKHPSYPLSGDPTPDNIIQIESTDWNDDSNIEVVSRQFDPIGRVDGTGAYWISGSTEPVVLASRAPGKVSGRGNGSESTPFQRLDGSEVNAQADLNTLTGHHYARRNVQTPRISLTLLGNYDVFEPAWMETLTMVYTGENIRNFGFVGTETFLITQVTVTHTDGGTSFPKNIKLDLEPVTVGEPGETIIIPTGDWIDNPFWDLFWDINPAFPDFDFLIDFTNLVDFEGETIGFAIFPIENQHVARSFTFGNEFVSYDDITPFPNLTSTWTLASIACQFSGTNVTCRAVYYQATTARVYLTTNAETDTPTWVLEETFNILGTTFNGAMIIRASDDPTEDLWAISWLSSAGVYETRRSAGAWQSAAVVGSAAFTDANWADKFTGMYISGTTVYCGGRTSTTGYTVHQATSLGAFSTIATTNNLFPQAIGDISLNLDGDLYASCYGDSVLITTGSLDTSDFFPATPYPSGTIQTNSYTLLTLPETDAIGKRRFLVQGTDFPDPIEVMSEASAQLDETYIFQNTIVMEDLDVSLQLEETIVHQFRTTPDFGATFDDVSPSDWNCENSMDLVWKITILTENLGGIVNEGTYSFDQDDIFTYRITDNGTDPPVIGYYYKLTTTIDMLTGIKPLPGGMAITGVQLEMTLVSDSEGVGTTGEPFYRGDIASLLNNDQHLAAFFFRATIWTGTNELVIEKADNRFYKIVDPTGVGTVTDILPPVAQFEGAPDRPFGIAPDWSDANVLHAWGRVDTNRWHHYTSVDKGSTWLLFPTVVLERWEKLNSNIELQGGENFLQLTLGAATNDRRGNLPSLYNLGSPTIGAGFVLFAE